MESVVSREKLFQLRSDGIITHNEVAIEVGDLLIAENVLTKKRRVLEAKQVNETKRLLKG